MAGYSQHQLIFWDAFAVVLNANALNTASVDANGDLSSAGIEGIFKQFFDNRGRAINDFASRNLTDQNIG